ncbi:MAG: MerR family transcriptional regulator [Pyramidobacter porci]|uniref:MerR family transcriptional regulator n=1 Tax=Pyramidobacter porci TaxID=2605789 RepID=UPI002A7606D9|nr:MerR family transcriptional regulator [Pyramidobacter porci]MDY2649330.1 MerR family transcriptional regulator [Pyramidobacter porci]
MARYEEKESPFPAEENDVGVENVYTIGQIAKLCDVSTKQLRYYDSTGALIPHVRDNQTGYRYYSSEQIEEVLLIKALRGIGISLEMAGRLVQQRDVTLFKQEIENALRNTRAELDAIRARYDATLDLMMRFLYAIDYVDGTSKAARTGDVQLLTVPGRTLAYTRYVSYWNANTLFNARRAELYMLITRYQLTAIGANLAIFHSGYMKQFSSRPEDGNGDLEVCVAVRNPPYNCPCCRRLPPFKAVSAIFVGHYRDMAPCYKRMESWAAEKGLELSGAALEEYAIGSAMPVRADTYVTHLYLPLKGYEL